MHYNFRIIVILITLCLFTVLSYGQKKGYRFLHYRTEDGLRQTVIRKVLQDKRGFLWIATEDGLHRFDGHNFKIYRKRKKAVNSLAWNHIYTMEEDITTGKLWLGTSFHGINILDPLTDSVSQIPENISTDKLIDNDIQSILISSKHVIAGTGKGISIINKDTYKIEKNISTQGGIRSIFLNKSTGYFWAFSRNGELVSISHDFSQIRIIKPEQLFGKTEMDIWNVSNTNDGNLWICSKKGLYKIAISNNFETLLPKMQKLVYDGRDFSNSDYTTVFKTSEKQYWAACDSGILILNDSFLPINFLNHIPDNSYSLGDANIYQIMEDKQHNLWFATEKGLDKISAPLPFIHTYAEELNSLKKWLNRNFAIYTSDDNNIFLAQINRICVLNRKTLLITEAINETGINLGRIYFITPFLLNTFLIGSREGIFILECDKNKYKIRLPTDYPELLSLKKRISTFLQTNNGKYLFGTLQSGGLYHWEPKKHSLIHFQHNQNDTTTLADNTINSIYEAQDGTIWLGTGSGYSKWDISTSSAINYRISHPGITDRVTVNDIYDDGEHLWLTVYQEGLVKWNKKSNRFSLFSEDEGLPVSTIYNIRPDNKESLWISSGAGLIVFNLKTEKFTLLGKHDGLQENEFNRFAVFASDSNLYFGGISGITVINKNNVQPPLTKNSVTITDFSYLQKGVFIPVPGLPSVIRLKPHINTFEVHFSSLDFINPENDRFEYMLKGWDKEWIISNSKNEVTYPNIPPGRYLFMVKNHGTSEQDQKITELPVILLPAWYQTVLFKAGIVACLLLLLFLIFHFRLEQIKKVKEVRKKISSDLHDDIGSTLSSVNIYAALAKKERNNQFYIDEIKNNINEVVSKLDDLVWSINPRNETIDDIAFRLRKYAEPASRSKDIVFTIILTEKLKKYKPSAEVKHHLYMSLKELINNSVKHACCKNIVLKIEQIKNGIKFSVSDDGIGYNITAKKEERNGLENIRRRADLMKAKLDTETGPGKGTTTSISIS